MQSGQIFRDPFCAFSQSKKIGESCCYVLLARYEYESHESATVRAPVTFCQRITQVTNASSQRSE